MIIQIRGLNGTEDIAGRLNKFSENIFIPFPLVRSFFFFSYQRCHLNVWWFFFFLIFIQVSVIHAMGKPCYSVNTKEWSGMQVDEFVVYKVYSGLLDLIAL